MTQNLGYKQHDRCCARCRKHRFATLTFERDVAAPVAVLWEAWTAPAAGRLGGA